MTLPRTLLLLASLLANEASAATLCVNPGGTDGCFASIQAAVDAAPSKSIIDIAAGTYVEAVTIPERSRLTLQGAGAGSTEIDGGGTVLDTLTVLERARITITGLTLRNGSGALNIADFARVTVSDCEIRDNSAGGVRVENGRLLVERTTLSNNGSRGLYLLTSNVEIRESTFTGHRLGIESLANRLTVKNSTISGNAPEGGMRITEGGSLTLVGSTLSDNATNMGAGGLEIAHGSKVRMKDTILANNTPIDCQVDEPGVLFSRGFNLVEDPTGCDIDGRTEDDIVGTDPMLGPLAENGGPTPTHALLPGSPAIGAGDPKKPATSKLRCFPTDQRGTPRSGRCDIGAFEVAGGL